LREQEDVLLAQLDRAHGDLTKKRHEYVSSVSERKSLLDTLIAEIEKKRDQPVVEFLMSSSLCCFPLSCEAAKAPMPEPVSPELARTVKNLFEMSQLVMGAVAHFKGKAKKQRAIPCCVAGVRAAVTLDPETASPYLILAKDCKTVWLADRQQNLPDNPKRFTGSPSVLGSQG
ncbi:TRI15 protein, partial [Herpetotheres cachinnans]|nr:TRI15 protein [Herpetotheres cachinnans]